MDIQTLKAAQDSLYKAHSEISELLNAYPRGATGLTRDDVKDALWHELKKQQSQAFAAMRAFNKRYAKKIRAAA